MIGSLQNEGLFQSMFQLTAEGLLILDTDLIILLANPACKTLFGIDSDTLLGKNFENFIAEKYIEPVKMHVATTCLETDNKRLEVLGTKKDGREFSLNIRLNSTIIDGKTLIVAFLRDITDRTENLLKIQQTKRKLLETNRKFETLINNIKGILFRCDNNRDYTMHYISEGCLEITGYTYDEFKNEVVNFGQLIIREDRNKLWEYVQRAIRLQKAYEYEYRITHKNGSIKYVWEKGEAVYDHQSNVIAIEGFIIDITAQKEAEIKLRHNEARTKAMLEAMPDIMLIQDREGNYIDCYSNNPQKMLWPIKKFIGANMKSVMPKSVYKKIKAAHAKVVNTGILQVVEYSVRGKKGVEHYEARVVLMDNDYLLTIVRDVTKERAINAQLNIKDNALASAINSITIADAQKTNTPIIYCNAAFEKITGYNKEEVYGRNCNFLQGDDRDQEEVDVMKNAIVKGEACNVVLRNYRKDGTLFWNRVTITPVRNKENIITHFIGVQDDITNKIEAENLKDNIQKILGLLAQDKPLEIVSKKIINTVETHLKDCRGSILLLDKPDKTLQLLSAPNLPKAFSNFINGTVIGPKAGSCGAAAFFKKEIIVPNTETSKFWDNFKNIELENGFKASWAYPLMSSTNKVLGILNLYSRKARKPLAHEKEILSDMTYLASIAIEKYNNRLVLQESKKQLEIYAQTLEQKVQERTQEVMATVQELVATNISLEDQILITKRAENEAVTSKTITAEVARHFPKGFIVVVNKDLQLVLAEGEALEELELKPLLFEGMTLDDISVFTDKRKERIQEDFSRTLSGKHLSFETEYKNRYFSVNTTPLFNDNKQINNALMVFNDISEQKEVEFNIQSALNKEKELNELKSRFVSMASHEFRTPLSAILTSAILIGKQNEYGKKEKREKYISQIEKNVNNLVAILNDFLSLSKLEEGKTKAMKERLDIIHFSKVLVEEININLKRAQRINFNTALKHLFAYLDPKLLKHIISNILSNASKYAEEDTRIEFKITQKQDKVLIEITDQGIGIPEEEQKYLFDRFFRAKNATNIEGTGLGLNIAKYYTELMGGTIGCKSKLNKGTTFWIELPLES